MTLGAKSGKYVGPVSLKEQFAGHISGYQVFSLFAYSVLAIAWEKVQIISLQISISTYTNIFSYSVRKDMAKM